MPTERPQVLKAALIYGGAQCVTALKEKGTETDSMSPCL